MTDKDNPTSAKKKNESLQTSPSDTRGDIGSSPLEVNERRSGSDRRGSVVDRRSGLDRRECPPGLRLPDMERRRGAGIRRPEDRRAAEEGELTAEQFEFVMAIEEFKRANNKTFPTWTDVLEVVKLIGYRKDTSSANNTQNDSSSKTEVDSQE